MYLWISLACVFWNLESCNSTKLELNGIKIGISSLSEVSPRGTGNPAQRGPSSVTVRRKASEKLTARDAGGIDRWVHGARRWRARARRRVSPAVIPRRASFRFRKSARRRPPSRLASPFSSTVREPPGRGGSIPRVCRSSTSTLSLINKRPCHR